MKAMEKKVLIKSERKIKMPNTSTLDKFLKSNHVKNGDKVKIISAGEIYEKEFARNGKKEKSFTLDLEVMLESGDVKVFSVNKLTRDAIEPKYGCNTEDWVNKNYVVNIVLKESFGQMKSMVVLTPEVK